MFIVVITVDCFTDTDDDVDDDEGCNFICCSFINLSRFTFISFNTFILSICFLIGCCGCCSCETIFCVVVVFIFCARNGASMLFV